MTGIIRNIETERSDCKSLILFSNDDKKLKFI